MLSTDFYIGKILSPLLNITHIYSFKSLHKNIYIIRGAIRYG